MTVYINLLPYMRDIDELSTFAKQWSGGIEIVTEGYDWQNNGVDWEADHSVVHKFTGPLSVHTPIFDLNLASVRYKEISEYSFETYKQSLYWAAKIGAKHAVVHPNLQSTPLYDKQGSQQLSKQYLQQLGEYGATLGIQVLVENVGFHDCALFNEEEFVELFNEIPSIDALLDIGHAHINNWDIPAMIQKLGTRLTAVHLHDNHAKYDEHLPIGEGTVQWKEIWDQLYLLPQSLNLVLEYDLGTPTSLLLEHAEALKQKNRKLGLHL